MSLYETIFLWGWGIICFVLTLATMIFSETHEDPMGSGCKVFFISLFAGWLWPIAVAWILLCLIVWLIRIPILGKKRAALM